MLAVGFGPGQGVGLGRVGVVAVVGTRAHAQQVVLTPTIEGRRRQWLSLIQRAK